MNKKKIALLALSVCMIAILAVGGSLAYLTDKDSQVNVFTTGDVYIDLVEEFVQNSKLLPGIDVPKAVSITNTGTEEAYVRVHIAIPAILDSGDEDNPQYAAYNNTLHFNMSKASIADGQWNWNKDKNGANYPENGGNWNCYNATVEGVAYNVYVATYETALTSGASTATEAMYKVFLDKKVTNQMQREILEVLGDEGIKILVAAEGCQKAGFENAYDALNEQFGVPGDGYELDWEAVTDGLNATPARPNN